VRLIYIRTAKGLPSRAEQMATIVAASGATEDEQEQAWVDAAARGKAVRWDERQHMLGAMREGDEVWIARPAVLGEAQADILDYLARLTGLGAVLCVASTGGRYRWHPDAREALDLAAAAQADARAAVLSKARAAIRSRPGNPSKTDTQWEVARGLWADPNVTAIQAAERTGMSVRHLYRRFGAKGTAPFTGGPKRKRTRA